LQAGRRAESQVQRRASGLGHFGLAFSIFALCLQLLAPLLHSSLQLGSRTGGGDLASLSGEEALCLGSTHGSSTHDPASPAQPSKDHHHDFAACCFWHANTSLPAPSPAASSAVSFDSASIAFLAPAYIIVIPAGLSRTFAARAPPVSA